MDDYAEQLRAELQGQYDALTERIAALDRDLARCTESEQRLVLQSRRSDLAVERRGVARQLTALENGVEPPIKGVAKDSRVKSRQAKRMDNDELTRLVYEIRSDVQILKEQFSQLKVYGREATGFSPQTLAVLIGIGILILLLLSFISVRIMGL